MGFLLLSRKYEFTVLFLLEKGLLHGITAVKGLVPLIVNAQMWHLSSDPHRSCDGFLVDAHCSSIGECTLRWIGL